MGNVPRILRPPKGSFFLFGPRGTGKSTWARENFPEAKRFDLLDEGLYHELIADPGLFANELRTLAPNSRVVVDEIQRIPGLLNEVHRFIEERKLRFALLGSSAKKQLGPLAQEERGPLLEGWVLGCLRAHAEVQELYDEIHYWAPAQGRLEVDFLLARGVRTLAIEVKSARKLAPEMLSGLRAIAGLRGLSRRILVYGGERKLRTEDGIDVWPPLALAQALEAGTLW